MSTTLENEVIATVENEVTQTDWMVISVEDWALIRRLVADGVPQRQVARDLGIGRSTVERALASDGSPKYSVTARYAGRRLEVRLGADTIRVLDAAKVIATHTRSLYRAARTSSWTIT